MHALIIKGLTGREFPPVQPNFLSQGNAVMSINVLQVLHWPVH